MPGKPGAAPGKNKNGREQALLRKYESLLQEIFQLKKEGVVLLSAIQKKVDKLKKDKILKIIDNHS